MSLLVDLVAILISVLMALSSLWHALPPQTSPYPDLPPQRLADYVFIIVVDGLRPEALQRARTPHLDRLWRTGSYTFQAQTVLPSLTLPAMASLLSGLPPDQHQLTWNDYMPEKGYFERETIVDIAHSRGLNTALFAGKQKLLQLQKPGAYDHSYVENADAMTVARAVAATIAEHQPQLVVIFLADVDDAGHRAGWLTVVQMQAVEHVDAAIGLLLGTLEQVGILDRSLIIVTADHGGHGRIHGTDDPRDVTIPWIAWGAGVAEAHEIANPVRIYDTAATVLWALRLPFPPSLSGRPVEEILRVAPRAAR